MIKNFFIVLITISLFMACGPRENSITSDSVDKAYVGMDIDDLKKTYAAYQMLDTPAYYFGLDGEGKDSANGRRFLPVPQIS